MRRASWYLAVLLAIVGCAWASDQEKAEKQIRMMTAMSRDDTARSIVSRTFADVFKMQRPQMVMERKQLGLNYGGLFLVHELVLSGTQMEQVAAQLRARKSIFEITNASHADWKRIAADAKKMNNRINDSVYKHFLHSRPDEERDKLERYNPSTDLVRADGEATLDEILKAQSEFVFWRNQAAPIAGGQADSSTPIGQTYQQTRDNTAATRGATPTARAIGH
jgi:hypothetical protein